MPTCGGVRALQLEQVHWRGRVKSRHAVRPVEPVLVGDILQRDIGAIRDIRHPASSKPAAFSHGRSGLL